MSSLLGKLIEGQLSLVVFHKKTSELTKALRVIIRVHLLISLQTRKLNQQEAES